MAFFFRKNHRKNSHSEPANGQPAACYRAVAASDVGAVREHNEDRLLFTQPGDEKARHSKGCLAMVADGMGGHKAGQVAAQMAIDLVARYYFDSNTDMPQALRLAFEQANKAIFQKASRNKSLKGMGTTCTAVILRNGQLFLGHVGDSRAYLLKGKQLMQLSKDHTYVQHLLDSGQITREESLRHPERNVITRAMGTAARLQADFGLQQVPFEQDDKLLLCSDGLYEYVKDDELAHLLQTHSIREATELLIRLAKQRGGHDNISVLLVEPIEQKDAKADKDTQKIHVS
ncbi:MAG: Stp1/IreP family PP2C-type Ser/Thr phosphatase [Bacteroidetes bacterium]|nr:MAG: Stp1/IreP family PP2C-type Ser/Thr phosphatase [Bacteroidota bacterium]